MFTEEGPVWRESEWEERPVWRESEWEEKPVWGVFWVSIRGLNIDNSIDKKCLLGLKTCQYKCYRNIITYHYYIITFHYYIITYHYYMMTYNYYMNFKFRYHNVQRYWSFGFKISRISQRNVFLLAVLVRSDEEL